MVQFVCRYHHDSAFYPGEHQHLQKPCIKALDVCLPVSHDHAGRDTPFPPYSDVVAVCELEISHQQSSAGGAQHVNTPRSASAPSELSVPTRLKEQGYSPLRASRLILGIFHHLTGHGHQGFPTWTLRVAVPSSCPIQKPVWRQGQQKAQGCAHRSQQPPAQATSAWAAFRPLESSHLTLEAASTAQAPCPAPPVSERP